MKILMVLDHEFPPDPRVENEINSLIKDAHHIVLACYTRNDRPLFEEKKGLTIYRKQISTFIYKSSVGALKFPFYFNFWTRYINEIIVSQRIDAVHIHDLPLARVGYIFSKKLKIPFVLDLHENWPSLLETSEHTNTFLGKLISNNKQWRKYEEEYCKKADYLITVVKEMKSRICKYDISSDKVIVLSNTFNLDNEYKLANSKQNEKLILFYAGGITKHRGLQTVINGLIDIVSINKNIVLWIVGNGAFKSSLEQIVTEKNLSEYVIFFGQKPFNETMSLLGKSDIALIPHLKSEQNDNSSPNKLFQYMYFQKPVMVSDCNSLEYIVNETSCGIVYKSFSPSSFATSLLELIKSDSIEELGKNGRLAVLNKYNWEKSSKDFLNMYNSIGTNKKVLPSQNT